MKKIYRIFEVVQDTEFSPYSDDYIWVDKDVTIKYVDSKAKVDSFFSEIEKKNKPAEKCYHCPLIKLTKRQYNNGNHDFAINTYCDNKDISFIGNNVFCGNEKCMDFGDYRCEEIEVE